MSEGGNKGTAAQRLKGHVDDLEDLLAKREEINAKIKNKKNDAKAEGFVVKAIMQIIRERDDGPAIVKEWNGLMNVYRAGMNMLNGDALSDSARRRLDEPPPPAEGEEEPQREEEAAPEIDEADIQAAREEGASAAAEGKKVADNPYPAGDPRRAAWDEGWCGASGGTGMEIPEAFRRRTPRKPPPGGAADGTAPE